MVAVVLVGVICSQGLPGSRRHAVLGAVFGEAGERRQTELVQGLAAPHKSSAVNRTLLVGAVATGPIEMPRTAQQRERERECV
jgi:hypothetical protein